MSCLILPHFWENDNSLHGRSIFPDVLDEVHEGESPTQSKAPLFMSKVSTLEQELQKPDRLPWLLFRRVWFYFSYFDNRSSCPILWFPLSFPKGQFYLIEHNFIDRKKFTASNTLKIR